MGPDSAPLSREECLRQIATVRVGRIIYTRHAMPAVELVTFSMDAGDIVIQTTKLTADIAGAVVAFEADEFGVDGARGWSVTAVGHARVVSDRTDIDRLRAAAPRPLAPDEQPYFMRITPGTLNGRWLTPLQDPA